MNVSEATIHDVRVVFDIAWKLNPSVFRRQPSFEGPLDVGVSREIELNLDTVYLDIPDEQRGLSKASDHPKWLDITARVEYRNRHGLLSEIQAHSIVMD